MRGGGGGLLEATGKPANLLASRVGDPSPTQSKPALSNAPVSTTSCTSIKFMPALLFWPPKIIFAGH